MSVTSSNIDGNEADEKIFLELNKNLIERALCDMRNNGHHFGCCAHMYPDKDISCLGLPMGGPLVGPHLEKIKKAFDSRPVYASLPRPTMLPHIRVPRDEDGQYSDDKKRIIRCLMGDFSVVYNTYKDSDTEGMVLFAYANTGPRTGSPPDVNNNWDDIFVEENCCFMVSILLHGWVPFLCGEPYPPKKAGAFGILPELISARILHNFYRKHGYSLASKLDFAIIQENLTQIYKECGVSEAYMAEVMDLALTHADLIVGNFKPDSVMTFSVCSDLGIQLLMLDRPLQAADLVEEALMFLDNPLNDEVAPPSDVFLFYQGAADVFIEANQKLEIAEEMILKAIHLALTHYQGEDAIWNVTNVKNLVTRLLDIYICMWYQADERHDQQEKTLVVVQHHMLMTLLCAAGLDESNVEDTRISALLTVARDQIGLLNVELRECQGATEYLASAFSKSTVEFRLAVILAGNSPEMKCLDYKQAKRVMGKSPEDCARYRRRNFAKSARNMGGTIFTCANCSHQTTQKAFMVCPCKSVSYCSVECQRSHWPTHKKECIQKKKDKKKH